MLLAAGCCLLGVYFGKSSPPIPVDIPRGKAGDSPGDLQYLNEALTIFHRLGGFALVPASVTEGGRRWRCQTDVAWPHRRRSSAAQLGAAYISFRGAGFT